MPRERSIIAGFTDYTGVELDDIIEHIKEWRSLTLGAIEKLKNYGKQVELNRNRLHNPNDILSYIKHFIDLFERYSNDFSRLIKELTVSVEHRHIETIKQICKSKDYEEKVCIQFKNDHIEIDLKDESLRNSLVDLIYEDTRGIIVSYYDLSNVVPRIEALEGMQTNGKEQSSNHLDAFELKPNFFGIGLNLNYIFKKIVSKFKRRRFL